MDAQADLTISGSLGIHLPVIRNLSDIVMSWAEGTGERPLELLFQEPFRFDATEFALVWRYTGRPFMEIQAPDAEHERLRPIIDTCRRIPGAALFASSYHCLLGSIGKSNEGTTQFRNYLVNWLYPSEPESSSGCHDAAYFDHINAERAAIADACGDREEFATALSVALRHFCKVFDLALDRQGPVKSSLSEIERGTLHHHWTNGASPCISTVRQFIEAAGYKFRMDG